MKQTDMLVLHLSEHIFCMEIGRVVQIMAYRKNFKVPKAPAAFSGVMHMKGGVVPIIDLSRLLGIKPAEPNRFSVTVTTAAENMRCGFVFDGVEDIVPRESMQDVRSTEPISRNEFIEKTITFGEVEAYVIDISKMMTLVEGICPIELEEVV